MFALLHTHLYTLQTRDFTKISQETPQRTTQGMSQETPPETLQGTPQGISKTMMVMIMMMMMNDGDDVGGNEDGWPAPFTAGNVLRGLRMITKNTKPQMFKRRRS
jgi:hypothetical protein